MEKKEQDDPKPEDGLSRRRFVKQVAAWGVATLAWYTPPRLRSLALAEDKSGAGKIRKSPGSDKLLLVDKDPIADKDPNEKTSGDKDPTTDKTTDKDPVADKDPNEKDPKADSGKESETNTDLERPGQPRRYAGPGTDEWGPDA
jgi:hypothetical protein